MSDRMTKDELIEAVRQEREIFERLFADVGEERMEQPGVMGDWTFKDIVAHLTGWRLMTLARLRAAHSGSMPIAPWPADLGDGEEEVEPINQWFYRQNRDRSPSDVVADARRTLADIETALRALPEDALVAPGRFAWLEGHPLSAIISDGMLPHFHEDHEPALRAWLQAAS